MFANSRFTQESEMNYKPIEGEALALVYGLKRSRMFVLGCPHVFVVTDHRPLVKIFGDKELEKIDNPRVFDLKEKTLMFNFEVMYREGPSNKAADALSRYPATETSSTTSMACIQLVHQSTCTDEDRVDAMTYARIVPHSEVDGSILERRNHGNSGLAA